VTLSDTDPGLVLAAGLPPGGPVSPPDHGAQRYGHAV